MCVDWRSEDDAIVECCESVLNTGSLSASYDWDAEAHKRLTVSYHGVDTVIPLSDSIRDRTLTVCGLNDILSPEFEIRWLALFHGDDTALFAVRSTGEWETLERLFPDIVSRNFIDPRELPDLFDELTDSQLPQLPQTVHDNYIAFCASDPPFDDKPAPPNSIRDQIRSGTYDPFTATASPEFPIWAILFILAVVPLAIGFWATSRHKANAPENNQIEEIRTRVREGKTGEVFQRLFSDDHQQYLESQRKRNPSASEQ